MGFKIFLSFITSVILFGRENPFQSEKSADEIPFSSNYVQKPDELDKLSFQLPNSAKIVEAVEVVYQNSDGSMERKRIDINRIFDSGKNLSFGYNNNEQQVQKSTPIISVTNINKDKKINKKQLNNIKNDLSSSSKNSNSKVITTKTKTVKTTKKTTSTISNNGVESTSSTTSTLETKIKSIGDKDIVVSNKTTENNRQNNINSDPFASYGNGDSSPFGNGNSANNQNQDFSSFGYGSNANSNSGSMDGFSNTNSNNLSTSNSENNSNSAENSDNSDSDNENSGEGKVVTIGIGTPRFSQFEFDPKEKSIKIATTDKKIRHFMLIRPNRIVIDFARELSFQNQTFDIKSGIFKEMKLSKKSSSDYRISIYIAEDYRYKLNRTESGYEIKCYK